MRNPCGAGVNMITVDVNGDLYPCEEMVGKPEFVIGNLADTSVREAIDTSPVVQKLRERHVEEIPECSRCTWKQLCHGGCVHKSYTHFKRLDRESEHCSYYKRIYEELIWLEQAEPGSWDALSPAGR
jgi:radical SAM protein with 4Fe4S-binding SPASM domain